MSLQFFTTDKPIAKPSPDQRSQLTTDPTATYEMPPASMVAFSVINNAANDPSTLLEKEVSSIDKLASGGVKLHTTINSSTIYHLPQNLLEEAMMDFSQLSPRDFTFWAFNFKNSKTHKISNYESADSMLDEFRNTIQTPAQSDSTKLEVDDWLEEYHWNTLSSLKEFILNALKLKLYVYRTNVGYQNGEPKPLS